MYYLEIQYIIFPFPNSIPLENEISRNLQTKERNMELLLFSIARWDYDFLNSVFCTDFYKQHASSTRTFNTPKNTIHLLSMKPQKISLVLMKN